MNEKNCVTVKLEWSCEAYTAELVPLKRKSIYGDRKVIAIDKDDKECSRIMYDESDMTLFPKKSLGICRLDEEGKIYSGKENKEEKPVSEYSDYWKLNDCLHEIPADKRGLGPSNAKAVYTLNGGDTLILSRLIGEKLFLYKGSDLVFQRKGTIFWIKPEKGVRPGEFAKRGKDYQPDDQPIVSDITDLDDIDFDMF